jgi:hypothetical protein
MRRCAIFFLVGCIGPDVSLPPPDYREANIFGGPGTISAEYVTTRFDRSSARFRGERRAEAAYWVEIEVGILRGPAWVPTTVSVDIYSNQTWISGTARRIDEIPLPANSDSAKRIHHQFLPARSLHWSAIDSASFVIWGIVTAQRGGGVEEEALDWFGTRVTWDSGE